MAPLNFRSRSVCLSPNQAIWLQQTLRGQDEVDTIKVVNEHCLDVFGNKHGCVCLMLACVFHVNNNAVDKPPAEAETGRDDIGATEGVQKEDDQPSAKRKPRMTAAEKRAATNRARIAMGHPPLPPLEEKQQAQPPSPSPTEVDDLLNSSLLSMDPSVGSNSLDATPMDKAKDGATPAEKTVNGKEMSSLRGREALPPRAQSCDNVFDALRPGSSNKQALKMTCLDLDPGEVEFFAQVTGNITRTDRTIHG